MADTHTPITSLRLDDVVSLVVAAREFWDVHNELSDESRALDKALEAFASCVPYENEPDTDSIEDGVQIKPWGIEKTKKAWYVGPMRPVTDRLPAGHVVLEQADMLDGRVSQTVSRPNGTEYERIVDGDEAYGSEE